MQKIKFLRYCLLSLLMFASYRAHSNLSELDFDIYETSHIHNNGSGKFTITADLSKVEQLIKMACLFAKVTPEAMQKSIQEAFETVAQSLKSVSGICNIATTQDDKMLCFGLSFQFNNIKALNEAVSTIYTYVDHPGTTCFKMVHHAFTRTDTHNFTQLLTHYCKGNDTQADNLILKTILKVTTYNIAYSFDKKIKKATHPLANIAKDRYTLFLKQPFFEACEKELSLSNTMRV